MSLALFRGTQERSLCVKHFWSIGTTIVLIDKHVRNSLIWRMWSKTQCGHIHFQLKFHTLQLFTEKLVFGFGSQTNINLVVQFCYNWQNHFADLPMQYTNKPWPECAMLSLHQFVGHGLLVYCRGWSAKWFSKLHKWPINYYKLVKCFLKFGSLIDIFFLERWHYDLFHAFCNLQMSAESFEL